MTRQENAELMFDFMEWVKARGGTLEDTEDIQMAKQFCIETGHTDLNGLELARLTGKEW